MAYINNPNEEEEKKLGPDGLPVIQSQNTQAAYSSDTSSGGSGSAPIAPNAGTGFVNLDKYRQANKGAGQITAKAVGDKAASAFETASAEADKLDTNVQGLSLSDSLIQGVANTQAGLDDSQKAELNKVRAGYQGPNDLDTAKYSSAYEDAGTKANQFTDREMQKAALQDIYGNGAKQRGVVYNARSAELDAALMEDNQGEIKSAVDAVKKSVDDKFTGKKSAFDSNKTAAKSSFESALTKVKDTAGQARSKLQDDNYRELSQKNLARANQKAGEGKMVDSLGADGRYGDVLSDGELSAASKYDDIFGDKTFSNTDKTYRDKTFKDKPSAATPTRVPDGTSGGGQILINPDLMFPPEGTPTMTIPNTQNAPEFVPGQIMLDPELIGSSPAQRPSGSSSTSKYRKTNQRVK